MADHGWFPFRQRSRTPAMPVLPVPQPSVEQVINQEVDDHRRPRPNRVSSYMGFNNRFSLLPEQPTSLGRASIHVNDGDKIWYNPSIEQMVEALQVVMMTKHVLQPIPVEYNSYVLHLIESFQGVQETITAAHKARDEAQELHDRISQDFKLVTNEWAKREAQYKLEVKRLEVIMSRTSRDGLETVTLARADSVVDRAEPNPRQFVSWLHQLRNENQRHDPISSLDDVDDYNAFLGHSIVTDENILKDLRRVDSTNHTSGKKSVKPRLPSILNKEKDFLISEDLRNMNTSKTKVQYSHGFHEKHLPASEQCSTTEEAPSLKMRLQPGKNVITRSGSNEELDFDSTSSSTNSDNKCQDSFSNGMLRLPRPTAKGCHEGNREPSIATLCPQVGGSSSHHYGDFDLPAIHTADRLELDGAHTSRTRFSFVAGDDRSFPVCGCQEARYNAILGTRGSEPNNDIELRLNEKPSLSQPLDRFGHWDDHSRGIFPVLAPTVPELNSPSPHGTRHGLKVYMTRPSSLRGDESTGSIDTVINIGLDELSIATKM